MLKPGKHESKEKGTKVLVVNELKTSPWRSINVINNRPNIIIIVIIIIIIIIMPDLRIGRAL